MEEELLVMFIPQLESRLMEIKCIDDTEEVREVAIQLQCFLT